MKIRSASSSPNQKYSTCTDHMRIQIACAFASLILSCSASNAGATMFTAEWIGSLSSPGSSGTFAMALNNKGQVTGNFYTKTGDFHPFIWERNKGMTDLGIMGDVHSSKPWSYGSGINDAGKVTGYSTADNLEHAFIWQEDAGFLDLGTLGDKTGWATSQGYGINNKNQVTGWSNWTNADGTGGAHAFIWEEGKDMTDLGTLGGWYSEGRAINDSGKITGSSINRDNDTHAFIWEEGKGMTDLGALGENYDYSLGFGINDIGQVTGSSANDAGRQHAFIWEEGKGMIDLGALHNGTGFNEYNSSVGYGINSSGQVVGQSFIANGDWHAFLYENGKMYDINDLIVNPISSISYFEHAYDINDSGQIVAITSGRQSYLLTPVPEPATMILFGAGLAGLAAARRRRKIC